METFNFGRKTVDMHGRAYFVESDTMPPYSVLEGGTVKDLELFGIHVWTVHVHTATENPDAKKEDLIVSAGARICVEGTASQIIAYSSALNTRRDINPAGIVAKVV